MPVSVTSTPLTVPLVLPPVGAAQSTGEVAGGIGSTANVTSVRFVSVASVSMARFWIGPRKSRMPLWKFGPGSESVESSTPKVPSAMPERIENDESKSYVTGLGPACGPRQNTT
jgi:hypothetical protein